MKKGFSLLTIVFLFALFLQPIYAEVKLTTAAEVNLDTTTTREDVNFNLQSRIVVVPIYSQSNDLKVTSEEFYRGLYYYTVEILGFNDIPFHYVISEDGRVFKGNEGGDERKIRIDGIGDDVIIIGYITNKSAARFTRDAEPKLTELLIEVASRNSIKPENIFIDGIQFVRNQEARIVTIEQKDIFGNWKTSLDKIVAEVSTKYTPKPKSYKAEVSSIRASVDSVNAGEQVLVAITIKNNGENGLYAGTASEIMIQKTDGNLSKFFLNNSWLSTTQAGIMTGTETLRPLQEDTFEFAVKAPLYNGIVTETFELRTIEGEKIDAPNFELALNITSTGKQIIEINPTQTNTLNVREIASGAANIITQVSPGQRFFVEEDAGNGWLRIDLGDGTTGWVAVQFVSFVQ